MQNSKSDKNGVRIIRVHKRFMACPPASDDMRCFNAPDREVQARRGSMWLTVAKSITRIDEKFRGRLSGSSVLLALDPNQSLSKHVKKSFGVAAVFVISRTDHC